MLSDAVGIQVDDPASKTYRMGERSERLDFDIRDHTVRPAVSTPHRHEFFQIQVNATGGASQVISGQRRQYRARSLIFVLPYRVHCAYNPCEPSYTIINFATNFLRRDFDLSPLEMEEVSLTDYPELAPFLYEGHIDFGFDDQEFAHIQGLLRHMTALNHRRRLGTLERIRGTLLELIGFTTERFEAELRGLTERRIYLQGRTDALKRAIRHIDENLDKPLSLYSVAEAAFLSPNYLLQLLKKHTGLAFVDWVTVKRMDRAQDLLAHSEDRIFEIANAVGFSDEAYFTRRFHQRFGLSPSEYRRRVRQG